MPKFSRAHECEYTRANDLKNNRTTESERDREGGRLIILAYGLWNIAHKRVCRSICEINYSLCEYAKLIILPYALWNIAHKRVCRSICEMNYTRSCALEYSA